MKNYESGDTTKRLREKGAAPPSPSPRVELTCWARSTLKKSGSYVFYQMIHFMAFLDSSHQAGSNCCFKILIIPIFDQVRRHKRKTNFRGPEVGT